MKNIAPALALVVLFAAPAQAQNEDAVAAAVEEAVEAIDAAEKGFEQQDGIEIVPMPPRTPETGEPYPVRPQLRRYGLIKTADYPVAAWRNDQEGSVGYAIEVSAEGKALSCKVTQTSSYPLLDGATCSLMMERAEFTAANDGKGQSVAGTYEGTQRWRKREPEFPGTFAVEAHYTLDENGEVQNCEIVEISGDLSERMRGGLDRQPCPNSRQGIPHRDVDGNPVAKDVVVRFQVTVSDPADE